MIATEPLTEDCADRLMPSRAAASDNNLVLDYFRVSGDHRLLFGAGETYSAKTPENLVQKMHTRMVVVFPQLADAMNRAPNLGRVA
jgi:gamma-glutamylputrescine oxidase